MTPAQVHLVRRSFQLLEGKSTIAALVFYRRLFELDPEVRPLFKSDIETQAKKLMDMLQSLAALLNRPERLTEELHEMGARHAGYGVKEHHYASVGEALIDMLAEVFDEEFTPAMREAWLSLYGVTREGMLEGARRAVEQGDSPETRPPGPA